LTLTLDRVKSLRQYHKISCFNDAKRDWLTLDEAAEQLKLNQGTVRKLLQRGILKGRQIVKYSPWMINPVELTQPAVQAAVEKVHAGSSVPPAEQQQSELLWQPKTDEVS
jgi:hypothetical protein